jgi:hypothetical protein
MIKAFHKFEKDLRGSLLPSQEGSLGNIGRNQKTAHITCRHSNVLLLISFTTQISPRSTFGLEIRHFSS